MTAGPSGGSRPLRVSATVAAVGIRMRPPAGLGRWLEQIAPTRARGEVAVALVSDARMRRLNREYRGVDRATDVLSFPAAGPPSGMAPCLGDIAIAVGVARRQARAAGHALGTELRVLALHGLLHLLGYDHERDRGQMRRVENRLRRRAGLPTGLIARAARSTVRA